MTINSISVNDLRNMHGKEALIIQGCGGDLTEWVNGMNSILTEEEILKDGFRFTEVYTFKNEGLTCLMFPLEDGSKINMGKLALWRIGTHHNFGGTWLSDYVENRLGGFARDQPSQQSNRRPDWPLIGQDASIYTLFGIASRTLLEHGLGDQVLEMRSRITQWEDYDAVLTIIGDYVNITSEDKQCENYDEGISMH